MTARYKRGRGPPAGSSTGPPVDWAHARTCSRWMLAYLQALQERRPISMVRPDYWRQGGLFSDPAAPDFHPTMGIPSHDGTF